MLGYLDSFIIVFAGVACCMSIGSFLELSITPSALLPPTSFSLSSALGSVMLESVDWSLPNSLWPPANRTGESPSHRYVSTIKVTFCLRKLAFSLWATAILVVKGPFILLLRGSGWVLGSISFRQDRYLGRYSILAHCLVSCSALALGILGNSKQNLFLCCLAG